MSMSMPSHRVIENLIATYAELVDDGDFAGVGALFDNGTFVGSSGPVTGPEAVTEMLMSQILLYPDGTPRTRHVTTNIIVDVNEEAGTAQARSSVTVLQATPQLPLQPIICGRYEDRFRRGDNRWQFAERRATFQLIGNVRGHLRTAAHQGA
jgi:3-phenylpropionate/cinnamic acid dioxygenase small subunit